MGAQTGMINSLGSWIKYAWNDITKEQISKVVNIVGTGYVCCIGLDEQQIDSSLRSRLIPSFLRQELEADRNLLIKE